MAEESKIKWVKPEKKSHIEAPPKEMHPISKLHDLLFGGLVWNEDMGYGIVVEVLKDVVHIEFDDPIIGMVYIDQTHLDSTMLGKLFLVTAVGVSIMEDTPDQPKKKPTPPRSKKTGRFKSPTPSQWTSLIFIIILYISGIGLGWLIHRDTHMPKPCPSTPQISQPTPHAQPLTIMRGSSTSSQ